MGQDCDALTSHTVNRGLSWFLFNSGGLEQDFPVSLLQKEVRDVFLS